MKFITLSIEDANNILSMLNESIEKLSAEIEVMMM